MDYCWLKTKPPYLWRGGPTMQKEHSGLLYNYFNRGLAGCYVEIWKKKKKLFNFFPFNMNEDIVRIGVFRVKKLHLLTQPKPYLISENSLNTSAKIYNVFPSVVFGVGTSAMPAAAASNANNRIEIDRTTNIITVPKVEYTKDQKLFLQLHEGLINRNTTCNSQLLISILPHKPYRKLDYDYAY